MVRCKNGSLYTGVTTDVDRRIFEHSSQGDKCAKYLKGKAPIVLVYQKHVGDKKSAYSLEWSIKQMTKRAKEDLIGHADLRI